MCRHDRATVCPALQCVCEGGFGMRLTCKPSAAGCPHRVGGPRPSAEGLSIIEEKADPTPRQREFCLPSTGDIGSSWSCGSFCPQTQTGVSALSIVTSSGTEPGTQEAVHGWHSRVLVSSAEW